ncbi:MAG: MBL fold metallo-hydrolase [Nitrospirota bacterium]|jgi:ribonuclease BN (tRNA processing enzyme)
MRVAILLLSLVMIAGSPVLAAATCGQAGVAVQVLGSGGPIADDGRASSGYLVWVDGRARLLVDAGGGTFLRFGEAGANIADLDIICLTHLHTDHAADLPALLKGGYFSHRTRPLPIVGPSGVGDFPDTATFLQRLFARERGAFAYLYGFLGGSDGLFATPARTVEAGATEPVQVWSEGGLTVTAVGVHHGPVPALGYLVTARGKRIAFSGDQRGDAPGFTRMIHGADLLVMAHAIPQGAGRVARNLHATPEAIGRLAAGAEVHSLLLSHLMARSLAHLPESQAIIRRHYAGPRRVAEDLMCVELAE